MEAEKEIRTGVVAIVGPPNAGKSTLMNGLLGQKISIVSDKPQTTRNRILGIVNGDTYQMIMLDTPGIHKSEKVFNLQMVKIAMEALADVDLVLFMVDVTQDEAETLLERGGDQITGFLDEHPTPAILLLNKIDLINRERLLAMIAAYREVYPFDAIIPISALQQKGTAELIKEILPHLPVGPRLYPEDIPTDVTERFIVGEIVREKIFLKTGQEIPYATAVTVDSFKEDESKGLITIHATIIVEKDSQKGIVIGKKGSRLAAIGQAARLDIENLLGERVFLKLFVKVKKNWTRDTRFLNELGY